MGLAAAWQSGFATRARLWLKTSPDGIQDTRHRPAVDVIERALGHETDELFLRTPDEAHRSEIKKMEDNRGSGSNSELLS